MDYRFIEKDPIIDVVRTAYAKAGSPPLARLERESGVCAGTIANWLYGETRKPQNWSVGAVLAALGVDTTARWEDTQRPVYINQTAIKTLVQEHLRKALARKAQAAGDKVVVLHDRRAS
jgi:hypothetical protein